MAYNKKEHLRQNIDAIKLAFALDQQKRPPTDNEWTTLKKYSGFGGIKAVLNPADKPEDIESWSKSDQELFPLVQELHAVLRENSASERDYRNYVGSLKNSILTAFYTPPVVVDALSRSLYENGVRADRILDPSAGTGNFSQAINLRSSQEVTNFEKDLLTGMILRHTRPENTVRVEGFENIEERYSGHFDLVASNIPFGDVGVFDPFFTKHDDPIRHAATRTIHNYFFVKSFDMLREGGVMAFITSQGVLDSERNRSVRAWLMDRCELVSAIRLPNNMFSDEAGTEVGSDLIVLQKHYANTGQAMTPRKRSFIDSSPNSSGIRINNTFHDFHKIILTEAKVGTNPYGQPAMVFTHSGGVSGIAEDLHEMLRGDIAKHLNFDIYNRYAMPKLQRTQAKPYYLFEEEVNSLTPHFSISELQTQQEQQITEVAPSGFTEIITPQPTTIESQTEIEQPFVPTEQDWQSVGEAMRATEQKIWEQHPPQPEDFPEQQQLRAENHSANQQLRDENLSANQQLRDDSPGAYTPDYMQYYRGDWRERLFEQGSPRQYERLDTQPTLQASPESDAHSDSGSVPQPTPESVPTLQTTAEIGPLPQPTPDIVPQPLPQPLNQEPIMTLYDLFGFSESERLQVRKPHAKGKQSAKPTAGHQTLFGNTPPVHTSLPSAEKSPSSAQTTSKTSPETTLQTSIEQAERQKQEEQKRQEQPTPQPFKGELLSHYREGSMIQHEDGRVGYLRELKGFQPMFHPLELNPLQRQKGSLYIEIRDTYHHLFNNEAQRHEENPALREMLNRLYDDFSRRFGELNDKKNLDFIKMDAGGTEILSLERYIGGVAQKADIFRKPVAFNPNEITHADNPREALAASLNKFGRVDLDYMAQLTDSTTDDILGELKGVIYRNPIEGEFQVADKYISGNVVVKAEAIERYLQSNPTDEAARESLGALRDVTPDPIAFEDLDFNFGERWIPSGIFNKYASHLMNTNIEISYMAVRDEFTVKAERDSTLQITEQYAVQGEFRKYNGIALLRHALHNTTPDITKTKHYIDDDGQRKTTKVRDGEKIQLANAKIEEIRNGFNDWLQDQTPEFKQRLAKLYNETFNCFVRPKYDGSHQTFPGLDLKGLGISDLYSSQKDAIWMDILNGGGICDHEVGGGKTLIMCCAAQEKKRLGIANKPLIIGLKANIGEIAKTYATAYPNARIIYPGKEDFTPSKRQQIFNQIKNNDFDVVILTHEQFGKIPQSPEIMQEIFQSELDSVEENLQVLSEQRGRGASRREMRGLEIRKQNLEVKLQTVADDIANRKDDTTDFRLMGIDHIYVDESHRFKNLMFTTRHDRVAGMGNPEGSKRALNMLFALRTIQQSTGRDLGATFLSGTTISNSLTELYLLFKYLRPQELERQNIRTFDAWAAIFAKKTTDYEFSVTGTVIAKERFRHFIKVPELAAFYSEITDYRTAKDIGIDRPEKNEILYNIPPTPDQADFTGRLIEFARTGNAELVFRDELSPSEEKALMLLATDYARKMSLDMRMVDPHRYGDDQGNKASHCAAKIAEYYQKFDAHKGTQFVFSDLGTYKPAEWNVYSEVKRKLVEDYAIPASEVRFIQEAKSETARAAFIRDMNSGRIRVLFGSTEMLGTGVNAQQRCVAIHHLDSPWRPSDLQQRDGRGIRKGNEVAKLHGDNRVDVILYAVERTLDAYKFGLLHNKQLFISQLKSNNLGSRTIDEGSMDEGSGMNFAEYVAVLSGNTDLLEKARLDKKIAAMESERLAFMRDKSGARSKLENAVLGIEKNDRVNARINRDMEDFNSRVKRDPEGNALNPIQIDGFRSSDLVEIGKRLTEIDKKMRTEYDTYEPIGSIYGFKICVKSEFAGKNDASQLDIFNNRFFVKGEGEIYYKFNNGNLATEPRLAAANPLRALETMSKMLDGNHRHSQRLREDIPALEQIVGREWRGQADLDALVSQVKVVDMKIQQELKPIEEVLVNDNTDNMENSNTYAKSSVLANAAEPLRQIETPCSLDAPTQTATGNFKEAIGDRAITGRVSPVVVNPDRKKGFKI